MTHEEKIYKHESYALIGFSRQSSNINHSLFGSSIKHSNTISLKIKRAEKRRDLNRDWYHANEQLIEVEMSQTQFAEAITSMNIGDGQPCTLRYIGINKMEDPPDESKRLEFEKEFDKKAKLVGENAQTLAADLRMHLINKGTRKELKEISVRLNNIVMQLQQNMPFIQSSFNEAMDKTVTEAKGEVEAFVQNRITSLGIEGLKNQLPQIESSPKNIIENKENK